MNSSIPQQPDRFTGVGTVLISNVTSASGLSEFESPQELVRILNARFTHFISTIAKYSGVILESVGDAVLAFWGPSHKDPNHAQVAFDASREILDALPNLIAQQKNVMFDIILGTGRMTGGFFGPPKQYQVVGEAMAIVTRLSKIKDSRRCSIRMSQYTADLIHQPKTLLETGIVKRDNQADLKVFTYYPANRTLQ